MTLLYFTNHTHMVTTVTPAAGLDATERPHRPQMDRRDQTLQSGAGAAAQGSVCQKPQVSLPGPQPLPEALALLHSAGTWNPNKFLLQLHRPLALRQPGALQLAGHVRVQETLPQLRVGQRYRRRAGCKPRDRCPPGTTR